MRKHCNVLMVGSLPTYLGARQHSGLGNVLWGLAQALSGKGITVSVGARGRYFRRFATVEGVDIHGIGISFFAAVEAGAVLLSRWREILSETGLRVRLRLIYATYFLAYLRRRVSFDCVHIHHVTNQFPLAARWLGIAEPIVAHIHSYTEISENLTNEAFVERFVDNTNRQLECVDHVIHVSRTVESLGRRHGVEWKADSDVIHNGLRHSNERLQALARPRQSGVVVFAGAFLPVKGVSVLLDSLAHANDSLEKLLWIGQGPLREEIVARCAASGIDFEMVGQVSNEELLSIVSSATVLVVPSISESFGQVYVEALVMGTPVVGYHEVLKELVSTYSGAEHDLDAVVPFDSQGQSAEELAASVRGVLEDAVTVPPSFSQTLARELHWGALVERYETIYGTLVKRRVP